LAVRINKEEMLKYSIKDYLSNNEDDFSFKKWISIILLIKIPFFIFYTVCYHLYPEISQESNGFLYVSGGDTYTYFPPLINVLDGGDYGSACRMPGLAIVFAPFYLLTHNAELSYNIYVVIQFTLAAISVYVLGLIANIIFNNNYKIFLGTIILYSFLQRGDNTLLADNIGNAIFIFAVYFFFKAFKEGFHGNRNVLLSGIFFAWAVFIRLIIIVPFFTLCAIVLYYFLQNSKKESFKPHFLKFIKAILLFTIPFLLFETAWIIRNKISLNRTVYFSEYEVCYSSFNYNWGEIRRIPIAWGVNITHWDGEIDWWINPKSTSKQFPYSVPCFTKSFNIDSLTNVKNEYLFLKTQNGEGVYKPTESLKIKIDKYISEYKQEHFFRYYVISPFKLFIKFHCMNFKMVQGLPFPAVAKMNLFQKGFKVFYWVVMIILGSLFLFSPLFIKKINNFIYIIFLLIPFSISIFLCFYLGGIEQRLFFPITPFCVIFFAYVADAFFLKKYKC